MIDAVTATELVHHAGHAPGEFPRHWLDAAYDLHRRAWARPWEGRLERDRFVAELDADHVEVLYEPDGPGGRGALLAYIKWKATADFHLSRDELSDPASESLPSAFFATMKIAASSKVICSLGVIFLICSMISIMGMR